MDGDNNANNNANNNVNPNAQGTTGQQNNNANQPNNNSNGIDYNKIQEMIDGRNAKTEDSVLKSYFQKLFSKARLKPRGNRECNKYFQNSKG